jgi:multisubunit Na+/H+ antiporter MnhC subunit
LPSTTLDDLVLVPSRTGAYIQMVEAHMPNLLSVIVPVGSALALAAIVIGVTVRVAVMVQPGTRFQSYWRSFFKTSHSQKNAN